MNYILVSVQKTPGEGIDASQAWLPFLANTQHISLSSSDSRRIAENVWLLERDSEVHALVKIVAAAEAQRLRFEVVFLSSD